LPNAVVYTYAHVWCWLFVTLRAWGLGTFPVAARARVTRVQSIETLQPYSCVYLGCLTVNYCNIERFSLRQQLL